MFKSFVINKYLAKEFLKVTANMSLGFFCLGFILNLFEEINFFKDFNVGVSVPILLTTFFVPSLLYNMFPFVILVSGIWFFLKIKKNDEIIGMKISGMSNFSVIIVPGVVVIFLGIFIITSVNPVISMLVTKYETIKGSYEKDQDYLAAITVNGIWIKEKNNIIRASKLNNEKLMNVTIYEFDNENNFVKRLDSKYADISSTVWTLKNTKIIDKEGIILSENVEELTYASIYNMTKIKSLYSNLDTVSFWRIENEIELLEKRGYSTRDMRAKLQKTLAFPFFLLSMILLSGVFTLGIAIKESKSAYIFIAILSSVLIFYFNDFSAALGKTGKLPIEVSVWMPILIIFIFSSVGLIHANQK